MDRRNTRADRKRSRKHIVSIYRFRTHKYFFETYALGYSLIEDYNKHIYIIFK